MGANTISVIIPCYNGAEFLGETIESVLTQTYPPLEVIVVDDGSTDNTGEVVARYPEVKYIRQKNQGGGVARNTGLRESKGDYLVFQDQDDRMLPNAFEIGVNSLLEHPECGFAYGICKLVQADGSPFDSEPALPEKPFESSNAYEVLLRGRCFVPPGTVMFRRSVFDTIGEFDPTWQESADYDIYLRAARAFQGYCHNQVIVEYRQHPNSASRGKSSRFLYWTLKSLGKQWDSIKGNKDEEAAYKSGKKHWQNLFGRYIVYEMFAYLKAGEVVPAARILLMLLQHYPQGLVEYAGELSSKLTKRV
jgi:glycosyltransferase involved in cell wall biosynthesis